MKWSKFQFSSKSIQKNIQNKKIKFFFGHILPYSPFYRKFFTINKISFDDIHTSEDIAKIPFSSKFDILPNKQNPSKTKDFILQPNEKLIKKFATKSQLIKIIIKKILRQNFKAKLEWEYKPIHIHFTTGRSTGQIPFVYTSRDLKKLDECSVRLFGIAGLKNDDVIVNAFPFAPHLAFWLAVEANRANNFMSLHTGGGKILGTEKILDAIEKLKATALLVIPGYGYHMLKQALHEKRNLSSLKYVIFGGERVSPGLREKVKEILIKLGSKNPKIIATYALTEAKTAWIQCHENSGYHLNPDMELIELVDKSGKPVKEGEEGEIVYTALDWRGSVVVRYKTGDFAKGLVTKPCEYCGRTVPQLHFDIERKFDNIELHLTKVKGEIVNLNTFFTLIHEFKQIDEWQVEIGKINNDPFELDTITLHISLQKNTKEPDAFKEELQEKIRRKIAITPQIIVHEKEVMIELLGLEKELKEKRIVDRRKK